MVCLTHQVVDPVFQKCACMVQQLDRSIVRTQSNKLVGKQRSVYYMVATL